MPELLPELREILDAYPGKWVALTQEPIALLAVGASPLEVYEAAQRAEVDIPILLQMPRGESQARY